MRPRRPPAPSDRERGQTSIDFLIGAGVFLLAVTFVFGVIPSMTEPFTGDQEQTLMADRLATQLGESYLGTSDDPTTLNETCTYAFFDAIAADGGDCPIGFEKSDDLPTRLGIDDRYRVNVTIERNLTAAAGREIVCHLNGSATACTGSGTPLADGPTPTASTDSVVTARRTVYLDGSDHTLVVRLW